jgi:hypothetical protein
MTEFDGRTRDEDLVRGDEYCADVDYTTYNS